MATTAPNETQHLYIVGLRNAHGLEHQALGIMNRQLDHLENYPEVAERLREHVAETEQQIKRVDEILEGFGESASGFKDAVLDFTGNMAAIAHVFAADEILKNSFANHAFENFEIAAYTSLIAIAESGGFDQRLLEETLNEERRMAEWVLTHIPEVTRKYIALRGAGETAGH